MSETFRQQLTQLADPSILPLLRQLRRGIEKESLRIDSDGQLAQTPHAPALGSALTHSSITTDYSEALLEFITPVNAQIDGVLGDLDAIHRYAYGVLPEENLWTASMPCVLGTDADIPVAQYGSSNIGRMKTIYRIGLGYRYGRKMQTIAGIHYNFSLPDDFWPHYFQMTSRADVPAGADLQTSITQAYFGMIRNFRRYAWLLIYLFGASPALCKSFLDGRANRLQEFDDYTLYLPHGTSLRMGDLGYQSNAQEKLSICYNRLDSYVQTLKNAILEAYPDYERIGVKVDGEYRQLSAGLLQIENEFYSPIRPKRVAQRGETALTALAHRGVEYIEVRCLDINPFMPLGVDAPTLRFIDAFLLFCLLDDSPCGDETARRELLGNSKAIVNQGRDAQVMLQRNGAPIAMREWAGELLEKIEAAGELLDRAHESTSYRESLAQQRAKIADPELTPSARVVRELRDGHLSYAQLAHRYSQQHAAHFRSRPLPPAVLAEYVAAAERSLQAQAEIEYSDTLSFDAYLQRYFDQYRAL
ncbi:MAG: glutamate--cysteine ligase [Spongiibacteraceae bacterium]